MFTSKKRQINNLKLIIKEQDRQYDCLQVKYSNLKKSYKRLEEELQNLKGHSNDKR